MLAISLSVLAEGVDRQLVGRHHDGRVGDLAHELRAEAAVEAAPALLPVHHHQRLPEGAVLGAGLPQPRPRHLCKANQG